MADDVAEALAWWTESGIKEGGGGAQTMSELSAEEERSWREEKEEEAVAGVESVDDVGGGGEKWREVTQLSWPCRRAEKESEKLETLQRGKEGCQHKVENVLVFASRCL